MFYTISLTICIFLLIILFVINLNAKQKKSVNVTFSFIIVCLTICCVGQLASLLLADVLNIAPVYFDYFVYVGTCFLPVSFLFFSIAFTRTRFKFKKSYLSLFIVPIITLIVIWTNDMHHWFYVEYSVYTANTTFGFYFYIHSAYSYLLLGVSLIYLIKYTIRNSGFFSKQSSFIIIGSLIPILINFVGILGIPMTIYITPISFTASLLFFALAILKFKFLSLTPIAIQSIVDRISDAYIVVDEEFNILDFNQTFLHFFAVKAENLRNFNLLSNLLEYGVDKKYFTIMKDLIIKSRKSTNTYSMQVKHSKDNRYFNVEISSIFSDNYLLATLILFKDVTQHLKDLQQIQDSQSLLMERERLASLGQLIGGIAHNLKTPIMSISGASEGLMDLIKEYDDSIDDPEVTSQDHHTISKEMFEWVKKIKTHTEYMSDVITAVKGQAVTLSENNNISFDLEELVKRVDILMRHELKNALVTLNIDIKTDRKTTFHGDIISLVQVINNIISNSIQAYEGEPNKIIDLTLEKDSNNIVITIKDYGPGLPDDVKDKIFKEMVTTKGKNGTGLGLFMSYSTIRAHFNGDITFETSSKGTAFHIKIPMN